MLSGRLETETIDGLVRTFGPRDVLLAADGDGRGHRGRIVDTGTGGDVGDIFREVAADVLPVAVYGPDNPSNRLDVTIEPDLSW